MVKRFYTSVSVGETAQGFEVRLGDKPVKTPLGRPVRVPARATAERMAAEWDAQGETIDKRTMPMTRLVLSAVDGVIGREEEVRAHMRAYAQSDLVCHRAEAPLGLTEAQRAAWDPVIAWAKSALGAEFRIASGVMPVSQSAAALGAVERAVGGLHGFPLAAGHVITTLTGSVLIALMVEKGALTGEGAWQAATVDEAYQMRQWGEDHEAVERLKRRREELDTAVELLTGPPQSSA